ncbi:MAG: hypothetical protein ACLS48_06390 [[Eubacterium] siraeum]
MLEKLRTDHENLVSKSGQDELLLAQIDKLQGTVDTYERLLTNTQISVTQRSRT